MKFILVVMLSGGYNANTANVSFQEFNNKQSCLIARQAIINRVGDYGSTKIVTGQIDVFCVAKGEE